MKQVSVIGYPRIGADRELKRWTESYFRRELPREELLRNAAGLRERQWRLQQAAGVDAIPSNDFSFYDTFLDTACLVGAVPERYRRLGMDDLDTYFAMAKGYQGERGDVRALPMKKWFNTNYHYIVPVLEKDTAFHLAGTKPFDEYAQAAGLGIRTKPVLAGPYTFLKLSENHTGRTLEELAAGLVPVYRRILARLGEQGAELVQLDEPALVFDQTEEDLALFDAIYGGLLRDLPRPGVLLQTYFGDVRDSYAHLTALPFRAVGLDFIEGPRNAELVEKYGFPRDKTLYAGVVNGKNIWVNDYARTLALTQRLEKAAGAPVVLSTSCSLLHVPYTVKSEPEIAEKYREHLAFAEEKLGELRELAALLDDPQREQDPRWVRNREVIGRKAGADFRDDGVRRRAAALKEADFVRRPAFDVRRGLQKKRLGLPLLPTTTIGSFPQTADVKALRRRLRAGEITPAEYKEAIRKKIDAVIALQEDIGLDVLVHGEYERNDMVEYFGEKLAGFLFTRKAWVQSYGTRCVKPPVIIGDVHRTAPMTVDIIRYAQSRTKKPVKGMLTGPVTILNWSFPREDLPRREIALQIALAIREEVEDLEAAGIRIIQIDEAALREKLPLRRSDWHSEYLDWAIPAFRLVHAGVKPETQIHTHMCYSEFGDILREIDDMDADVITFEAARSDLSIIDRLREDGFRTEVGPGVYDIHSPRVPDTEEMAAAIRTMTRRLDVTRLWVNPDCGLKTRGEKESTASLRNMVRAARQVREELAAGRK